MLGSCPTLSREILEFLKGVLDGKLEMEKAQANTNGKWGPEVVRRGDAGAIGSQAIASLEKRRR